MLRHALLYLFIAGFYKLFTRIFIAVDNRDSLDFILLPLLFIYIRPTLDDILYNKTV